ncbi:phage repressor protein [Vibrio scophthalmi]|uniref:HTH Mu-type domain-containing protein n=1 Tax=Vibrio scophthalmi TaxID=45658 RepID=A0A1E3WJ98_9VIBR|nr:phage repressor protein [Vibrio scophthalmi]ODS09805.1 hypothetical protein VSF3289_00036 [Vibrio scophthalmi]
MKEWFLSTELINIDGLPNNTNHIGGMARRNNWLKRKAIGKGRSMEYHISNFHPYIQKQLIEKYVTDKSELDKALGEIGERSNITQIKPLTEFSEWCELPVFDVYAAAGAGCLVFSEYQVDSLTIPTTLIEEFGLSPDECAIIYVDGDSMEPTLSHHDRLLIDITERQNPVASGVYVIRIDEAVYVKRLRWDIENAQYQVISDNLDYPQFAIDPNNGRNFKIIGKAIAPVFKRIL